MINVEIDQELLKELYLEKVDERLAELEAEALLMNSKQLCAYLNMSWNSIVEHLLYDEEFPSLRLGAKWLFYKKEIDLFMDKFYYAVRDSGGDILKYKKKD